MRPLPSVLLLLGWLWLPPVTAPAGAQPMPGTRADSLRRLLRAGGRADTNRVRTLLQLGGWYAGKTLDPARDLDSALVLARQAGTLSRQLGFLPGAEAARLLEGTVQVKMQRGEAALRMLEHLGDTSRIRLLLELGKSKLRPTYAGLADRDQALAFFGRADTLSRRIGSRRWSEESGCLTGTAYVLKGDWPRGKAHFRRVVASRRQAGDKAGELTAWLRMATPAFCDDCRENLYALSKALALARQTGDQPREAIIRLEMGYKYLNRGDARGAEREARLALAIQEKVGYPAVCRAYHALADNSAYNLPSDWGYLSNAYYLLSDLSQVRGDLNQKLYYILEIVKSAERNAMHTELDYAYFRLGNAYWELGQYIKSTAYHRQSLAVSRAKGELFIGFGLARRMSVALLKAGKGVEALAMLRDVQAKQGTTTYEDKMFMAQGLGACYAALGRPAEAERHYLESVAWSRHCTTLFRYNAWKGVAQFYVTTARYAKADPYVRRLLRATHAQLIPSHRLEVYLMRFKVDSARGHYRAAIRSYQQYKALTDSVFNEKKSEQISRLSIQYETGKKEQALRLREKDVALLTARNRTQQALRNTLAGGAALLLALLGVIYNRYRLKARNNRLLQVQREELQAQQEELRSQHEELQTQQEVLQAQQGEIHQKNAHLSELLGEKESLLRQQDALLAEKDQLLAEKERLLKEIHHRVKNNLQIVMSLLNSQAASLADKAALSAIRESQHRVQAMALIHQKLYQSEGLARIAMECYLEEVVAYLSETYCLDGAVGFQLAVEPLELDVNLAVPVGLVVNEAITNALKYAFPGGRRGTVRLSLLRVGETACVLTVADDGVGLPDGFDPACSRSLGMTLMHGFSEQLGGELTLRGGAGLTLSLRFDEAQPEKA